MAKQRWQPFVVAAVAATAAIAGVIVAVAGPAVVGFVVVAASWWSWCRRNGASKTSTTIYSAAIRGITSAVARSPAVEVFFARGLTVCSKETHSPAPCVGLSCGSSGLLHA